MKEKKTFSVETNVLGKVIRVSNAEEITYVIFPYVSANESKTAYLQDTQIEKHYKKI